MATSKENDLIGYDPLAWMEDNTGKDEETIDNGNCDSGNEPDGQHLTNEEISMTGADDYSDDLVANSEENITKEDEIGMDEMPVEIDTIVAETGDVDDSVVQETVGEESAGSQVDLDATLTIQNVVKLYEKLKDSFAIHDQIEINASDVSSIDTATLQLLVSLKKEAVKQQKQVTIIYPSPRFVESAQLLGLTEVLDVQDA